MMKRVDGRIGFGALADTLTCSRGLPPRYLHRHSCPQQERSADETSPLEMIEMPPRVRRQLNAPLGRVGTRTLALRT